jgi:uncharacterized protein YndB with AHSA1/START domain
METFNVNVKYRISEPIENVFDAIINPEKITKYFVSKVNGKLAEGKQILWNFEDVGVKCEVDVLKVVENKQINFNWNAIGKPPSAVTISLDSDKDNHTNIEITENSFELSKEGVQKALGQTQGWTDFICSLKAYLYAGINLRNGMN